MNVTRAAAAPVSVAALLCCLVVACSGSKGGDPAPGTGGTPGGVGGIAPGGVGGMQNTEPPGPAPSVPTVAGTPVTLTLSAAEQAEEATIRAALAEVASLDHAGLKARHAVALADKISYDAGKAAQLGLIQGSPLALNTAELAGLAQHGLVISERRKFPSFPRAYEAIYMSDLPVFVSADSIVHAVHRSYDEILKALETQILIGELRALLDGMRDRLRTTAIDPLGAEAKRDADLYLAVARRLLDAQGAAPVAGASGSAIDKLVDKAETAKGEEDLVLFGAKRHLDFSQFTPRGHYTDSPELTRYFKAMMWLGRVDFRMIETESDGSQVFYRRQWDGVLALWALVDDAARAHWKKLDDVITAFVGEADNLTLDEMGKLTGQLGGPGLLALAQQQDAAIAAAIMAGGFGAQRIASQIMINDNAPGTLPLARSFLLLGQRYVIDSHVFSNVVFDRVKQGAVKRMMPDPLDVAFAALGNDQAIELLAGGLGKYDYASELAGMRVLADAHGADFWSGNLYNRWLTALRALSPAKAAPDGLPSIARTRAWGRRLLNTQLASWAELRHDTILYAKQSYTAAPACEFPDAYVEPYPEFFAAIGAFAVHGAGLVASLGITGALGQNVVSYFDQLAAVAAILREMAEHQRTGTPHSAAHLAFINDAVKIENVGCVEDQVAFRDGWYRKLFFDPNAGAQRDPTIADVHTQPTDEGGNFVGHVLHVGTGLPRMMVVTFDTCSGPRAYVGVASSYFERVTKDFLRLDDPTWSTELHKATPPDVPWMSDLVVR